MSHLRDKMLGFPIFLPGPISLFLWTIFWAEVFFLVLCRGFRRKSCMGLAKAMGHKVSGGLNVLFFGRG